METAATSTPTEVPSPRPAEYSAGCVVLVGWAIMAVGMGAALAMKYAFAHLLDVPALREKGMLGWLPYMVAGVAAVVGVLSTWRAAVQWVFRLLAPSLAPRWRREGESSPPTLLARLADWLRRWAIRLAGAAAVAICVAVAAGVSAAAISSLKRLAGV
ncbi:MAG: hypothetical protein BIFFINMI_01454 [Phycisphaerae bacterium]|nr:hypothetical protein [Phycisphaerae bacterium]